MAVLPAGTELPPPAYVAVLLAGAGVVGAGLARSRPRLDARGVLALAPWMALGAASYVASQLGLVPDVLAPFAGSPTVYVTVAVLAGAGWLATDAYARRPRDALAGLGAFAAVAVVAVVVLDAVERGQLSLDWPLVALAGAAVLSAVAWVLLRARRPRVADAVGGAGPLVLFAHSLDGLSTAVGYDVLGFGERSPLSRAIIEFAATLPTAELIGAGWLFVLVKLTLAVLALWLLADVVRETPTQGFALLAFVAAVGLGPGVHNLLLFSVVDPYVPHEFTAVAAAAGTDALGSLGQLGSLPL